MESRCDSRCQSGLNGRFLSIRVIIAPSKKVNPDFQLGLVPGVWIKPKKDGLDLSSLILDIVIY